MEHHHESLFADPRFWVGVAFVVFFVIFGRKIWGIIVSALDQRAIAVRAELDEAARLRHEAEALLVEARNQRASALKSAEELLSQAHAEAARVAAAARADAHVAAARREQMAMDRIAAAEKAAVSEVRLAAADVATRAAELVISQEFGAAGDSVLIDNAIHGLPAALGARRAA